MFRTAMRNFLFILVLACGSAWAVNPAIGRWPLVGPGSARDISPADSGAGPHEHFTWETFERRVDPPREQIAQEKTAQAKKAATR